ncbi:MAG: UDP-N-acetylmuramoyl-tripeptide--D-alanyl-D-alanine ligase [Gammaproteobacteria bacterium]
MLLYSIYLIQVELMLTLTTTQLAAILGLTEPKLSVSCEGVSIDTRTLQPGNLFIAITGSRVDGHEFLQTAYEKDASAAIVSHPVDVPILQLVVDDTIDALGKIGAAWRDQFNIPILAVTGSNGKTTLKNMMASILRAACQNDHEVLATQGNFNNHLGLPLTLTRLNAQHKYAVIEMGMNHFGEIAYLTKLTRPQVAVITNAAAAHLEGVGDVAGVARAKAEIFQGLAENGIGVINRDDAFYPFWREQIGKQGYLTFGFHPDADINAKFEEATNAQSILIHTPQGSMNVNLPLLGRHNVLNALAATAATLATGIPLTAIKQGLENAHPAPGRLQLHTLANGVNVIDDTYNANPFSLQAAVDTLATFAGKKILVLGDMRELGDEAPMLHQQAGERIRDAGIDFLFTYGDLSEKASQAFGKNAFHFAEQEKLITALQPLLHNTTTILVKGSRSMQMEKVIAGLVQ